jgi:hypothetical protein
MRLEKSAEKQQSLGLEGTPPEKKHNQFKQSNITPRVMGNIFGEDTRHKIENKGEREASGRRNEGDSHLTFNFENTNAQKRRRKRIPAL